MRAGRALTEARREPSRAGQAADTVGREMEALSTMGIVFGQYTCVLNVPPEATFADMAAEACQYWGIAPEGVFLQVRTGLQGPRL